MSDTQNGPGWWQASDGKWYPPESHPSAQLPPPPPPPTVASPMAPPRAAPKGKKPWWRRWWAIALAAFLAIGIIGAATGGGDSEEASTTTDSETTETDDGERQSDTTSGEQAVTEQTEATKPAETDAPTSEAPTTTAAPERGVSLAAPAQVGEAVSVGDWVIRVAAITPDASAPIAAENQFNDPPAAGRQFFMATLQATYVGNESATFWIDTTLKAVGASNVAYEGGGDADCGVIPDSANNAGEVFPGGTIIGNVCWSVESADAASLTMIAEAGFSFGDDGRRFLSLDPAVTPVEDSTTANAPAPQGIAGVPIGETVQAGDWTIKVVSVTPDASGVVAAENQFNDPPAEGRQFFMAALEATYTGTESATFWLDMNLKAVGISSVAYESSNAGCGVIPNSINDAGETFPGGVITGNVCWAVTASDAASLTMLAQSSFSFDDDDRKALSLV